MISLKSIVTRKLLNHFFINPEGSLYVNELSRLLGLDKRNLVKKLIELEREGILKSGQRGNLKLYSINREYPLYDEYQKIVLKTVGFEKVLKEALSGIKGINQVIIYGSYAKDKMDAHSDIDVLIVGSHSAISAQRKISKLQPELRREINLVNMTEVEFKNRIKKKDPFIHGVLKEKHVKLI